MGYIYKITNKNNNKMYIGKTTETINVRWSRHISKAYQDLPKYSHFQNAIRKYGRDSFIVEEIEQVPDKELSRREQFWIAYYDTYKGYGYNSTYGGDGALLYDRQEILDLWNSGLCEKEIADRLGSCSNTIKNVLYSNNIKPQEIKNRGMARVMSLRPPYKVEQYDLNGQYLTTYDSVMEASKAIGAAFFTIQAACEINIYSYGYYWKYAQNPTSIEELIEQYKNNKNISKRRSVDQYDFNGNYLKTWRSATEAAEEYNCTIQNILRSCSHYRESARGYLWTYSDSNEDMNKRCNDYINKTDPRGIGVRQYDLEGNFLHYYPSLNEAARENNIEHTALQKAFRNRYTSGGYVWLEPGEEDEWLDKIIQRNKTKHDNKKKIIQQYDLNDNFIAEYPAAKDAAAAIGFPDKWRNLQRVCQGYQKTCCGFKWKYKE